MTPTPYADWFAAAAAAAAARSLYLEADTVDASLERITFDATSVGRGQFTAYVKARYVDRGERTFTLAELADAFAAGWESAILDHDC